MLMPLPNSRFITQYFLHFFSFNHLQSKSVGLTLVCVFWCDEKKKVLRRGKFALHLSYIPLRCQLVARSDRIDEALCKCLLYRFLFSPVEHLSKVLPTWRWWFCYSCSPLFPLTWKIYDASQGSHKKYNTLKCAPLFRATLTFFCSASSPNGNGNENWTPQHRTKAPWLTWLGPGKLTLGGTVLRYYPFRKIKLLPRSDRKSLRVIPFLI